MRMTRFSARLLALTVAAGLLLTPVAAQAAPARPKATSPGVTANVTTMPILTWKKAARAATYEVQIASDAGFNPAMIDVTTGNIRYIHTKVLPNGAYFWRLRSLDKDGGASKWTPVRKFTKKWAALATLSTPANLGVISYPSPVILRWSQVSGASTYLISVAGGAPGGGVDAPGGIISSGALAINDGGKPISTTNTNFAISTSLHPGTYYWQITPVDAEGHAGKPSSISSFAWTWNGATTPSVSDMVAAQEIFDPLFTWAPILGAASYQVEVNADPGFAPGSRMLLRQHQLDVVRARCRRLPDNSYYWRVRGVDPQGQAGPWNNGAAFDKAWDRTSPPGPQNLTVYNSKLQAIAPGGNVNEPVVTWSTVPGARTYEVQLNCPGDSRTLCDPQHVWTPRGHVPGTPRPRRSTRPGRTSNRRTRCPLASVHVSRCAPTRTTRSTDRPQAGPFASIDFHRRQRAWIHQRPRALQIGCVGALNPAADIREHAERNHRRQEPADLLEAGGHGSVGRMQAGRRLLGRDRARSELRHARRGGLHEGALLGAFAVAGRRGHELLLAGRSGGRRCNTLPPRRTGTAASPPRRPSSTARCRRPRSLRSAGRARPAWSCSTGASCPRRSRTTRSRSPRTIRSARSSSRPPPTRRPTRPRPPTRSARPSTGACGPTTTTARGSRGRAPRPSSRRCRCRRSRRRGVLR